MLRQAIEARGVGQTWLEEVVIPCGAFSGTDRTALREAHATHGAAILTELEWPSGVVELLGWRQTDADDRGDPRAPVSARIMAALIAYERLARVASREPGDPPDSVLTELGRLPGTHLDPEVVSTLVALARSSGDVPTQSG